LQRRHHQPVHPPVSSGSPTKDELATAGGVVTVAPEPLLAIPVRRAVAHEHVEDRGRPRRRIGDRLPHAQHEPIRGHVTGA